MDVAKLGSKGRLTIPQDIRTKLGLQQGNKVAFVEEPNGRVYLANASLVAFKELVASMQGEAAAQGILTEADVNDLVRDIRSAQPKP